VVAVNVAVTEKSNINSGPEETPGMSEAIPHFLDSGISESISLDRLRYVLLGHAYLKTVVEIPMKRERAKLDPGKMRDFYDRSSGEMAAIPSVMLFNLEQTGREDWADRQDIRVIVTVSYWGDSLDVPCDRSSKRLTRLVSIAVDVTAVKPVTMVLGLTME
jgi:hypothetical protein